MYEMQAAVGEDMALASALHVPGHHLLACQAEAFGTPFSAPPLQSLESAASLGEDEKQVRAPPRGARGAEAGRGWAPPPRNSSSGGDGAGRAAATWPRAAAAPRAHRPPPARPPPPAVCRVPRGAAGHGRAHRGADRAPARRAHCVHGASGGAAWGCGGPGARARRCFGCARQAGPECRRARGSGFVAAARLAGCPAAAPTDLL
jgi:hypothetical protein